MSYYSDIKKSIEGEPKSKKTLGQMLLEFDAERKQQEKIRRHEQAINAVNSRIDRMCEEAMDEIKTAADNAQKFINYSAGQQARRMRERLNHGR